MKFEQIVVFRGGLLSSIYNYRDDMNSLGTGFGIESQGLITGWREIRKIGMVCVALSLAVWYCWTPVLRSQDQMWTMNLEASET